MEQNGMGLWCGDVVKRIRFRHDRAAVAEELYVHLEESRDFLMEEEGLSQEEAERAAIAAMGDPVELGKELNQVHSPLLGWLWLLSRWMVRLLFVALVALIITGWQYPWALRFSLFEWIAVQVDPLWTASDEELCLEDNPRYQDGTWLASVEPAEVTAGPYTISVLEGQLVQSNWEQQDDPKHWYGFLCYLRIEAPPWHKFPDGLSEAYLVFDDGTVVVPDSEQPDTFGRMDISYLTVDEPNTTAQMRMEIQAGDWSPKWVELRLPEEIGDFALRLNLEYREVTP